jgi:putative oxidoreductase
MTMLAVQLADPDAVNLALVVLRLTCGLMIMAHGYNHIFGGGKIQGTAGWFASMGMKPGILHAWLASVTELAAGAMLVVGLFTPLACAGLISVMIVALVTAHRKNGFFIFKPGQGWEYVAFIALTALALGAIGAGEWSLDDALDVTMFDGWTGLWVSLGVGVGGATGLLAVFYRPTKQA